MQVTELKNEGLRREYQVVVTAAALEEKTNEKLETVRADFQMKGFRKGKAPMPLLKKMFGKSVLGEVVQEAIDDTVRQHLESTGDRPAQQPDIQVTNQSFEEGDDLNVEIKYDCLPDVPEVAFTDISLERKVVEVDEAAVDEALERLAASAATYDAKDEGAAAEDGDQVVIDFLGKVDDVPFEGGQAEDYPLVLGSNQFIPGFEEQLMGAKAGDERAVEVTFPESYQVPHLAGKPAIFDVTVKEVRAPKASEIDDSLAERFGAEDLDGLKGQIRDRIGQEFGAVTRQLVKRRLLDALDEKVAFDLPSGLVTSEAQSVAQQLYHEEQAAKAEEQADEGDGDGSVDAQDQQPDPGQIEPTEEHVRLAERRVRLGLLLAEIGTRENVEITEQELGQAIMAQARQYPGQEREFFEFVKQDRGALEQIRAPLYEDKVVDLILGKISVTDIPVSKEDLQAEFDAIDQS